MDDAPNLLGKWETLVRASRLPCTGCCRSHPCHVSDQLSPASGTDVDVMSKTYVYDEDKVHAFLQDVSSKENPTLDEERMEKFLLYFYLHPASIDSFWVPVLDKALKLGYAVELTAENNEELQYTNLWAAKQMGKEALRAFIEGNA